MSTERITRLQSLLERIKKNGALLRPASNLVFGGAKAAPSDVSAGPAVPAASFGRSPVAKQTDVAAPAAIRSPEIKPPPAAAEVRTPTLAGMVATPVAQSDISADAMPIDVIEELDIDEIEVVDITESPEAPSGEVAKVVTVEPQTPAPALSIPAEEVRDDELRWSEPPTQDKLPGSSPRPRIAASSLDEALTEAAEAEAAAPLKTPPPESGRQLTEGVYAAAVPTAEQLGETLELEAPTSAELELDVTHIEAQKPKEALEFELPLPESALELPPREQVTTYTSEVAEPDSHAAEQSQVRSMPEEIDTVETPVLVLPPDAAASTDSKVALSAELTTRNIEGKEVVPEFVLATRKFEPKSFAELLDASLMLVPKD